MVPKCEQSNTNSHVLLVTCLSTSYNDRSVIFPVKIS